MMNDEIGRSEMPNRCFAFHHFIPQSFITSVSRLPHNQFIIGRGHDGFDRAFVRECVPRIACP